MGIAGTGSGTLNASQDYGALTGLPVLLLQSFSLRNSPYECTGENMRLIEYPDAIAAASIAALEAEEKLRDATSELLAREADFKASIAEDRSLKNDSQRKARLAEYQQTDGQYLAHAKAANDAKTTLELGRIEVQRLRDWFEAEKLLIDHS